LADWERGDYGSAGWADPEVEFVIADGPAPGSWVGLAAMAEGFRGFVNAWEDFRTRADEYRELDDEQVLVVVEDGGRGKTSGIDVAQMHTKGAVLFRIERGKVTRLVRYWDGDRALADLGRAPEDDAP
jgi:ketosteroid isomerase-like protein